MISHCLLCGAAPDFLAFYTPGDQRAAGAPAGKTRAILYGLCEGCQQLPDAAERCEERIRAEMAQDDPRRN
jgi:hypothetical protein